MLIVVMVVGVLFSIAVFQLDSVLPESRLKRQVRLTMSMIELSSSQAVVEGRPLALSFDKETRKMTLDFYEDDVDTIDNIEVFEEDSEVEEPLYEEQWPEALDLSSLTVEGVDGEPVESEVIVFLPEGSCDGAVIRWRESTGLIQEMELWPLLGKVSLSEIDDRQVF
jgi:type II secretory pathway pseudopilin PulG